MDKTKKALKIAAFAAYFLTLLVVSSKLFFEKQFDEALNYLKNSLSARNEQSLAIGYSEPLLRLDPLANDVGSRARLYHIYEGLLRMTPDLKIEPVLAVSYGSLDDVTWEFRLRPDVFFHDGRALGFDDVLYSLTQAKNDASSDVRNIAATMKEIQKVDDSTFRIVTNEADPLLASKLSLLLIFGKNGQENGRDGKISGTGPYELVKNEDGALTLKKFARYWGDAPAFEKVYLRTFKSRKEKINALENATVDIAASVPSDVARDFKFEDFKLQTLPSLEVNFLMFNFNGVFAKRALRQAVNRAISTDQLVRITQGFMAPTNQFVGNGIFGYDPTIKKSSVDLNEAAELAKMNSLTGSSADLLSESAGSSSVIAAVLNLPNGLEFFGKSIREQLRKAGIDVKLHFLPQSELAEKITDGESDFYFFGWRNELGDSYDFLASVIHSRQNGFGQFNGNNYSNPKVDGLIELSRRTLDAALRLEYLREAMRIITMDDVIGVPLFSPELLYGVSKRLNWRPRVDGYVLAQEVKTW